MRPNDCPSEHDLRTYLRREGQTNQSAAIETHLVGCRRCRGDLLNWQQEAEGLAGPVSLPPKLKKRVVGMGSARNLFFPNLSVLAGSRLFATAALVLVALTAAGLWRYLNQAGSASTVTDPLRAESRRAPAISPTSPAENAVVSTPTIVFNWTTDAEAIRYTIVILDEGGDIVHQAVTTSGQLTLDISKTHLQPQKRYFWHVRAKLTDGTELETKPLAFSVQSK